MAPARGMNRRGRLGKGILVIAIAAIAAIAACGDDGDTEPQPEPPAGPDIVLNELLAANTATLSDEFSDYDDFVELANGGAEAAATAGLFLTDDLGVRNRWPLPDTTLPAGGILLIWADGEPAEGRWHATFRLSADGEEVGLFYGSGLALVDSTTFGPQRPDTSLARTPAGDWVLDPTPTPGRSND